MVNICNTVDELSKINITTAKSSVYSGRLNIITRKDIVYTEIHGIESELLSCTFGYLLQDNDNFLLQDNGFRIIL